eukprot:TRINITY_DN2206_c0_g1_i5.p1 TRINITY_DN2206_c0_g1~~TRINITY_DN2206_c0_g1_i5.p1  ORF type:complete len:551 (-),score=74.14 TRINITY_DN2206_c0_g1_i5:298-1950(-)
MGRARSNTRGVIKESFISQFKSAAFLNKQYDDIRELGSGSFGHVRLVRDRVSGQERVIKTICTRNMSRQVVDSMLNEIKLLKQLDHPLIVKLFEFAEDIDGQQIILVLEYIPGGDCLGFVKGAKDREDNDAESLLPERVVVRIMLQLLISLQYCHAKGVVHRDIKPENLMMVEADADLANPDLMPVCKLIDFGLACSKASGLMFDYTGTPKYMAPEVHRHIPYTSKADIWSAGCTAIHLLVGHAPFARPYEFTIGKYESFDELEARLVKFPGWRRVSARGKHFLRTLLQANPDLRPTAANASQHAWFSAQDRPMAKLTQDMTRSLAGFTAQPPVVRCCLFSIASRMVPPNLQALSQAFLHMDEDCDGIISHEDLRFAVEDVEGSSMWWTSAIDVNVDDVLATADFNHNGGLGFTEFVAACSLPSQWSVEDVARISFQALDIDRDGFLRAEDISDYFRERDHNFLRRLPRGRLFDVDEWCEFVDGCSQASTPRSVSGAASPARPCGSNAFPTFGFFLAECTAGRERAVSNADSDASFVVSPNARFRNVFLP